MATERVARDAAIRAVIEALLAAGAWVVWGPNILRETPNPAPPRWHVDLESRYWPMVTVAVDFIRSLGFHDHHLLYPAR